MMKCSVTGCEGAVDRKGFCTRHYMRERRNGDPTKGRRSPGERVAFVNDTALSFSSDECLLWPYFINKRTGYAQSKLGGASRLVHRYVCEVANGPAPTAGHQAAHSCGVRACVNPRHLSWKTPLENEADKIRHGTKLVGEAHPRSLLSDDEETAVFVLRGRLHARKIAEIFGVPASTVYAIQHRLQIRRSSTSPE